MRILVVNNLYLPVVRGGYEVECRDVVEHLRGAHQVEVLTSTLGRSRVPAQDGVQRILPFSDPNRAGVLRAPYSALRGVRIVRRVLAEQRPDLVYVWNGAGLPHAALRELNRSGVPVAYRVCQQWFGGLYRDDLFLRYLTLRHTGKDALWAVLVRAVNRLPALRTGVHPPVDVAVCWNSDYLRSTVPVPDGLRVVHEDVVHPINAAADALDTVARQPAAGRPVVLFVGRVAEEKGIQVAIRAVAVLRRDHGLVVGLRVVGDGESRWRRQLETVAAAEGIAEQVSFAGAQRGAALHAEIAAAAVWVVPSVWDEPAGMVAVEAGLARVPLVASRVGGIPELLREPDEALMFDRGDSIGCAAALAETVRGGPAVQARVQQAHVRARGLMFGPYLERMDRFLHGAVARLGAAHSPRQARERRR